MRIAEAGRISVGNGKKVGLGFRLMLLSFANVDDECWLDDNDNGNDDDDVNDCLDFDDEGKLKTDLTDDFVEFTCGSGELAPEFEFECKPNDEIEGK